MKILLIDDDITSLEVLHDVLILNDFECDAFSDPVEAVEQYYPGKYVAVLTDYLMNKMSGIDVLRELKKKDSAIKVMIYSACEEEHLEELALNNGAYIYFTKPISWIDIERVLQEIQKIYEEALSLDLN